MPGRPPVAPWLGGLDEEEPQTAIAWRAELDIEGFGQLDLDEIEEWFDAHRILSHETLAVPASKAAQWMLERWTKLPDPLRTVIGDRPCVIDRAGLQVLKLKQLVHELERKRTDSILNADLILPASFGGIARGRGLLDENAPLAADSLREPDVADVRGRCRLLRVSDDDIEQSDPLCGVPPGEPARVARFALDLPSDGDRHRQLISIVPRAERVEFGTTRQPLVSHVGLVKKHAHDIAQKLKLSGEIYQALELAAVWHDHGKDREIWQLAAGRKPGEQALGKSGGSMGRMSGGYRHEFGSLREFIDAYEGKIPTEVFDLAMHLIATHHGRGRPNFAKGGFDPLDRSRSPQIALEALRRFARLQRKYGHWRLAWIENLLRCADAMALDFPADLCSRGIL